MNHLPWPMKYSSIHILTNFHLQLEIIWNRWGQRISIRHRHFWSWCFARDWMSKDSKSALLIQTAVVSRLLRNSCAGRPRAQQAVSATSPRKCNWMSDKGVGDRLRLQSQKTTALLKGTNFFCQSGNQTFVHDARDWKVLLPKVWANNSRFCFRDFSTPFNTLTWGDVAWQGRQRLFLEVSGLGDDGFSVLGIHRH